ncbi:MAG TPA: flagellar hook-basal body complex protein FliE [Limnochordales bacterium]
MEAVRPAIMGIRTGEAGLRPAGGPGLAQAGAPAAGQGAAKPFSRVLQEALDQVNRLQLEAQAQVEALAAGQVDDLHRVALAVERAQLALELTVAVRNKLLEAYQEISRMPV